MRSPSASSSSTGPRNSRESWLARSHPAIRTSAGGASDPPSGLGNLSAFVASPRPNAPDLARCQTAGSRISAALRATPPPAARGGNGREVPLANGPQALSRSRHLVAEAIRRKFRLGYDPLPRPPPQHQVEDVLLRPGKPTQRLHPSGIRLVQLALPFLNEPQEIGILRSENVRTWLAHEDHATQAAPGQFPH